jgi:hypothetical protein
MRRRIWRAGVFALGLVLLVGSLARAEHVPTMRTSGQKSSGARTDITVPYLTTGDSAFMGNSVAPRVYGSPQVDDPNRPQVKPVYNLPFYGAVQSFGDRSNGAVERDAPLPRRR